MWPSISTPRSSREEKVSWHPWWEGVWSRQRGCACLGSTWAPAPQRSSSKAMEKAELQRRYQPVITSLEVWHFAAVESPVAEKLARPPCQGYRQPNTPCLPPPDSLSLRVCSPSSKASVWLSFADVGLLTIPLGSLPPCFCSSQNSFQFVKIFSGNKESLDSVQDPRACRKKVRATRVFCLQSPSTAGLSYMATLRYSLLSNLLFTPTLQNLSLSFFQISSSHGGFFSFSCNR